MHSKENIASLQLETKQENNNRKQNIEMDTNSLYENKKRKYSKNAPTIPRNYAHMNLSMI